MMGFDDITSEDLPPFRHSLIQDQKKKQTILQTQKMKPDKDDIHGDDKENLDDDQASSINILPA